MSTAYPLRVLVASLVVAALPGCGADDGEAGEESAPARDAAATAESGTGTDDAQAAKTAAPGAEPVAVEAEVAPADLANFACTRKPNGWWKAEGSVTNSAGRPMVYTVTVVTVDNSEQVLGEQIRSFELEPEQIERFGWPRFYRGDAAHCMPHVERTPS